MKILFLDIDGVMNSHQSIRMHHRASGKANSGKDMDFCPIACANLQEILARLPDLKLVISSTWRIGRDLDGIRKDLEPIGIDLQRIIGMTPVSMKRNRGAEIGEWLKNSSGVLDFVIVDDDSDMDYLMDKLVQTDTRMGLMWDKACEILKRFGEKDEADMF